MQINLDQVAAWNHIEVSMEAAVNGNPFKDVRLSARFDSGSDSLDVDGFYDGGERWVIRFMPHQPGDWSFRTSSSVQSMDGLVGGFLCTEADSGVHGPVRVSDRYHFAYADGTPHYPVGTTCYVWNHQGAVLEAETIESLAASPFNKIRFCVFPKRYTFNHNEPECYPFPGEVTTPWNPEDQDDYSPKPRREFWDFDYFNPEYFRHLDECVLKLRELGIEADLILFHPYDFGAWGFDCISEEVNNRLLRYLVARLGAFRNIWWSFANEYDLFQNKSIHEWHRYMKLVQAIDPYDHLRSIHNCREFYDHTKPWVTHCSIQSSNFARIPEWQDTYHKPVVIDECGYEGNINRDWGNISGQQMTHLFWTGFTSGAYVGHGETYLHSEDILWWSKGGELHGESPERIAFLRSLIEGFSTDNPEPFRPGEGFMPKSGRALGFGVFPEFGLYYFGLHRPSFRYFNLPDDGNWEIEVIDTWQMTRTSLGREFSGNCRIDLPGRERMAVLISRC